MFTAWLNSEFRNIIMFKAKYDFFYIQNSKAISDAPSAEQVAGCLVPQAVADFSLEPMGASHDR
jgi:hypothetical protein